MLPPVTTVVLLQMLVLFLGVRTEYCSLNCLHTEDGRIKSFQQKLSRYQRKCDHSVKLEVKVEDNKIFMVHPTNKTVDGILLLLCDGDQSHFIQSAEWTSSCNFVHDISVGVEKVHIGQMFPVHLPDIKWRIHLRYIILDPTSCNHEGLLEYNWNIKSHYEAPSTSKMHLQRRRRQVKAAELFILATVQKNIYRVSMDGTRSTSLVSMIDGIASAVDYDYRRKKIYWIDRSQEQVLQANLDGTGVITILDEEIINPYALAVDWITSKLYITDMPEGSHGIIRVFDPVYFFFKTLLQVENINLVSIILDPNARMMYWSSHLSIEKASMDGSNKGFVHNDSLTASPTALAIDYQAQRIYWITADYKVQGSGLDGNNITQYRSDTEEIRNIAFHGNALYTTEALIPVIRLDNSTLMSYFLNYQLSCSGFEGIIVACQECQPLDINNPCAVRNGECSHFCLLSNNQEGYSCSCPEGLILQRNRTCEVLDPSNLGSQVNLEVKIAGSCIAAEHRNCCDGNFCMGVPANCYCDSLCKLFGDCCSDVHNCQFQANSPYFIFSGYQNIFVTDSITHKRFRTILSGLRENRAIDYHYRMGALFWTSYQGIWRSNLLGTEKHLILADADSNPAGIAVDWISDKLYWTDDVLKTINLLDLHHGFGKVLHKLGGRVPSYIIVDPNTRLMFWIDNGHHSRINKASMDGLGSISILAESESTFMNIALDYFHQRIYWSSTTQIGSVTVNGSNIEIFRSITCITSLLPLNNGNLFYVSCKGGGARYGSILENGILSVPYATFGCGVYQSKIVSPHLQIVQGNNPCANDNGGCNELCLLSALEARGYICANTSEISSGSGQSDCLFNCTEYPIQPGNCSAAGHMRCCEDAEDCRVYPATCSCDAECRLYGDCCSDIDSVCPKEIITGPPPLRITLVVNVEPSIVNVIQGESASIQCNVQSSSTQHATTEWYFVPVQATQEIEISNQSHSKYVVIRDINGSVLHIKNTMFSTDQGLYYCRARVERIIRSSVSFVNILFSPQSVSVSGSNSTMEMNKIELICLVRANPMPTIVWVKRNNVTLINPSTISRVVIYEEYNRNEATAISRLTIKESVPDDGGIYACEATNSVSQDPASSETTVEVISHDDCSIAAVSPCQNGSTCIDMLRSYSCICSSDFIGRHCSHQKNSSHIHPKIKEPPKSSNASLSESVNLTCIVNMGDDFSYEWFKDGVLSDVTQSYFYIQEITPERRGNYTCVAIGGGGEATSTPARVDIPEILQYNITFNGMINITDIATDILSMGSSINQSLTIASVETISDTTNTILVTLLKTNDSISTVDLRKLFISYLESLFSLTRNNVIIRRFDYNGDHPCISYNGCDEEEYEGILWPETSVRHYANEECTCSEFVGSLAGRTTRYCNGDYTNGAYWETYVDKTNCAVSKSNITRQLCETAMGGSNSSVEVAETVAHITSNFEKLEAADISATSAILRQLTNAAIADVEVAYFYLEIIDNIQQASPDEVFKSQLVTRSSQSIIENLEIFSDLFNGTQDFKFSFNKFALQLEDVELHSFHGQSFLVNLGSVEEALKRGMAIGFYNLKVSEAVLMTLKNSTALVEIPEEILTDTSGRKSQDRISYTVFLTDTLFQTEPKSKVGSIILSVRVSSIGNATLTIPVIIQLRKLSNESIRALADNPRNGTYSSTSTDLVSTTTTSEMPNDEEMKITENCSVWDHSLDEFGAWSKSDCHIVSSNGKFVKCECAQLGHYALLFDLNPQPPPLPVAILLNVITYVGTSISLLTLLFLVVTYLSSTRLRTNTHSQILIHMSLSLGGLYIFFLLAGHVTKSMPLCGLVSALLHYFILVFFIWTAVEAVWLYIKLVKVFGTGEIEQGYIWKAGIPAWILPVLVLIISFGSGHRYYISSYYCSVKQWPFWFGLLLPFSALYSFNWIMFMIILISVSKSRSNMQKTDNRRFKNARESIVIAIALAAVFGLGWGFGLAATSSSVKEVSITFQIIFSLLISLQGLLLFILHGIRNPDARALWKKWFCGSRLSGFKLLYTVTSATSEVNQSASAGTCTASLAYTLPNKGDISDDNIFIDENKKLEKPDLELSVVQNVNADESIECKTDLSALHDDEIRGIDQSESTLIILSNGDERQEDEQTYDTESSFKLLEDDARSEEEKVYLSSMFLSRHVKDEVGYLLMPLDDESEDNRSGEGASCTSVCLPA